MGTLTIHDIPAEFMMRLEKRATLHGRTIEQEAYEILSRTLANRSEKLAELRALWSKNEHLPSASEVNAWIASGRMGKPNGSIDAPES